MGCRLPLRTARTARRFLSDPDPGPDPDPDPGPDTGHGHDPDPDPGSALPPPPRLLGSGAADALSRSPGSAHSPFSWEEDYDASTASAASVQDDGVVHGAQDAAPHNDDGRVDGRTGSQAQAGHGVTRSVHASIGGISSHEHGAQSKSLEPPDLEPQPEPISVMGASAACLSATPLTCERDAAGADEGSARARVLAARARAARVLAGEL